MPGTIFLSYKYGPDKNNFVR